MNSLSGIEGIASDGEKRYNVYDLNGVKVLTNAESLDSLAPEIYVVNGTKTLNE